MKQIEMLFLLFMIYSFLGWMMEVVCCFSISKKIINRGFLIGPYCPIYGFGALFITLFLDLIPSKNPIFIFITCILICSFLEYSTSYILEKIFHARWWDYSDKKFNLNGRICLETMVPFGILGLLIYYITNPIFKDILGKLSANVLSFTSSTILFIVIIDILLSLQVLIHFRSLVHLSGNKDHTEEVRALVRNQIQKHRRVHKRFLLAFPNISKKINSFIKKIKL
ncbi:MAG: putative ABC transporter permease [Firmicutes bacterium]|nr:putative ABC transporter permease [Bacillota bacterium]